MSVPSPVQLYLSSSDATQQLNGEAKSDLIYLFTSPVIPPQNYNMTLKVVKMYLPISFTIINSTNNNLNLNTRQYTIPHGNYSATDLATAIMDAVSEYEPSFTVEFNSITNKYRFSDLSSFELSGTIMELIGFYKDTVGFGPELFSHLPVDLTGQNIIYIDVKNLSTFNLSSSTQTRTSIVGSVLVNVPYGSVLYYEDTTGTAFTIQEDHISFIHVRLLGEDQKTLLDLLNFD